LSGTKRKEKKMKIRTLFGVASLSLIVGLALSIPLTADDPPGPTHYRVVDLGTLGGTDSSANAINNIGWATGGSDNASQNQIATLWLHGSQIPLGTLGGLNSNVSWPVKNNFGLIAGTSENGKTDPLNETFSCPAVALSSSCVAFAWQNGKMTPLPGLGGNNSIGGGDNDRGQIVGWAENSVNDPTCAGVSQPPFTQYLQFEATLWQRDTLGRWHVRELPPYPGDPDGAATAINDLGQAVGISGTCDIAIGAYSAIHALIWDNGKPIDLGNLGGHGWNTPEAINNRGVVTGFVNGSDDVVDGQLQFRFLAFIWTKEGGMQSLGALPEPDGTPDQMSEATDINDENQIVGVSFVDFAFDGPRAFIWQNGTMTALNDLIGSASANWAITSTGGINDSGMIAAQANPVVNGVINYNVAYAVLLVPCGLNDPVAYGAVQQATEPAGAKQARRYVNVGHFRIALRPQGAANY
jgi:probable HAF family extracellular repeat protein